MAWQSLRWWALAALACSAGCAADTKNNDPLPETPDAEVATPAMDMGVRAPADTAATPPGPDAAKSDPAPLDAATAPAPDSAAAEPADGPPLPTTSEGDDMPDRPLNVDRASPQAYTFKFKPSDADPMASSRDETQTATFDSRAPKARGKLVVVLSGYNGAPGPLGIVSYTASLGYHAFAIAYQNGFNPSTQNDPKFFGDARQEAFDGMDRTPRITVARPDCVEVRVAKALAYLQTKNAAGDWAYYLKKDGTVRWSDVIFMGHSHGASSAAMYAKVRRIWRAISLSGPRDTSPVTATWLTMPSQTPIDRYFGFTGTGDAQHQDHQKAMAAAGYVGTLTDVGGASPPYGGSHRLKYNGGHGGSASCTSYDAVCKYMLGAD